MEIFRIANKKMNKKKMTAKLGVLSSADGSAELSSDRNRLLAGVMGPGDTASSKRLYDRANVLCTFYQLPICKNSEVFCLLFGGI
jgi:ribonuclease PH